MVVSRFVQLHQLEGGGGNLIRIRGELRKKFVTNVSGTNTASSVTVANGLGNISGSNPWTFTSGYMAGTSAYGRLNLGVSFTQNTIYMISFRIKSTYSNTSMYLERSDGEPTETGNFGAISETMTNYEFYFRSNTTGSLFMTIYRGTSSTMQVVYEHFSVTVWNGSLDGVVGIGTSSPTALLDVAGTIRNSGGVVASSDRRIKSNIIDLEDDIALQLIRRIKPKTYSYRDTKKRGLETVYGFIAQEVRDVLNYATSTCTDAIPNIYEQVTLTDDVLTFTDFSTIDLVKDASGELFTTIRLTINGVEQKVTIMEVLDEHTLKVALYNLPEDVSGQLVPGNKIFVYGQEVNDFHTLNKDAIWTVATAALQEVDRQLQAEKQKVSDLQTALASTQETLASVLARLTALEQKA